MYEQSTIASSISRKRKNEIIYHSLLDATLYVPILKQLNGNLLYTYHIVDSILRTPSKIQRRTEIPILDRLLTSPNRAKIVRTLFFFFFHFGDDEILRFHAFSRPMSTSARRSQGLLIELVEPIEHYIDYLRSRLRSTEYIAG